MKTKLCMVLVLSLAKLNASNVINLSKARKDVEKYYASGKFEKEVAKVTEKAWKKFKDMPVTKNSTVVIDIDDTLISSYQINKGWGFGNLLKTSPNFKWAQSADLPAIKPVLGLYKKLVKKGFKIVLLTSRPEYVLEATKKNLHLHGYKNYERIILRSQINLDHSNHNYKEQVRIQLAKEGYHIAGCIGDQHSDLAGKHTGLKVKIPNYIYEL